MGILRSFFRYVRTLGGLIESDIDGKTDDILSTPSGIKATFGKTREEWRKQYTEVREAVAQLMTVLEEKLQRVEALNREADAVKTRMKGAVEKFREGNDATYQKAFADLFNRDKEIAAEQEGLSNEVEQLRSKIDTYKAKLQEMQTRIAGLARQESEAIADIVSSRQIVKLNDRLSNMGTELDDRNLQAIEKRRQTLVAQAKLSGELHKDEIGPKLEDELMAAGMKSEAADVFAAMLSEGEKKTDAEGEEADRRDTARQREL